DACRELLAHLGKALDEAHRAATDFDWKWRLVRHDDLVDGTGQSIDSDEWWMQVLDRRIQLPVRLEPVLTAFRRTQMAMKEAEVLLRPWVVRHLRPRLFEGSAQERRL